MKHLTIILLLVLGCGSEAKPAQQVKDDPVALAKRWEVEDAKEQVKMAFYLSSFVLNLSKERADKCNNEKQAKSRQRIKSTKQLHTQPINDLSRHLKFKRGQKITLQGKLIYHRRMFGHDQYNRYHMQKRVAKNKEYARFVLLFPDNNCMRWSNHTFDCCMFDLNRTYKVTGTIDSNGTKVLKSGTYHKYSLNVDKLSVQD